MGRQVLKNTDMLNAAGVPFAEIIREYRKRKKMSQEELGALVNIRKNAVGAWEAGRSRPDISSVPVICDALEIPLDEFFGYPLDKNRPIVEPVPEEFRRRYAELTEYHRKIILRQMDSLLEMQKPDPDPEKKRKLIPIYLNDLSACAGPSAGIGESRGERVWVEKTPQTILADEIIRVSGDSMEPEFHDGDRVLVRHGAQVRPGDVAIFVNGDAGYIKVYQRDGLHSLNPKYPVMHFSEGDEVRCIGKVLGIAGEELFAREDELADFYD